MDLALWNIGTFKEVMKWCDFMENMHDSLTDHDVHQLEQYLKDPKSFSAAGRSFFSSNVLVFNCLKARRILALF